MIGLASSGPHSNGYTLVRKVIAVSGADLFESFEGERTLGQALLEPTRIYVKPVLATLAKVAIKGLAHITGGGLTENIPRVLPEAVAARIEQLPLGNAGDLPTGCSKQGNIEEAEMHRTFNCGIGMVLIVSKAESKLAHPDAGGERRRGLRDRIDRAAAAGIAPDGGRLKSAVILISGRGSNMRAIVEARTGIEVKAVISNRPGAAGLEWASAQGLATQVVDHRQFATREAFDAALGDAIAAHSPDLILLAGFMRILTPAFIERFPRRILNIHPSLLPAFPGLAHPRAGPRGGREAARLLGAHGHAFARQRARSSSRQPCPCCRGTTRTRLSERVLAAEHRIYPQAVRWFVEGRVEFDASDVVRIRGSGVSSDCIVSPRNAP